MSLRTDVWIFISTYGMAALITVVSFVLFLIACAAGLFARYMYRIEHGDLEEGPGGVGQYIKKTDSRMREWIS